MNAEYQSTDWSELKKTNNDADTESDACNGTYFALQIPKTGDAETDEKLKLFKKETVALLKSIREKYRGWWTAAGMMYSQMKGTDSSFTHHVPPEYVDNGIKYEVQQKKEGTFICCYVNFDEISMFSKYIMDDGTIIKEYEDRYMKTKFNTDQLNITNARFEAFYKTKLFYNILGAEPTEDGGFALGDNIVLDGKEIDAEVENWINGNFKKETYDKINNITKHKVLYDYFKKLGITSQLPWQEILDLDLSFQDFLLQAAKMFEEVNQIDAIIVKMCSFVDGKIGLIGIQDEEGRNRYTEQVVNKDYLLENPDKEWYINVKKIGIASYKQHQDNPDAEEIKGIGYEADYGCVRADAIIPMLDKICEVFRENWDLIEQQGMEVGDLDPIYLPHVMMDGEPIPLQNFALVSGDMDLLEVQFSYVGSEADMLLTKY